MKNFMKILISSLLVVFLCYMSYECYKFYTKQKGKKIFNIVMVGAAGSGKGTQSNLIKKELNLLQISAGDVLRNYVKENPNSKISKEIKSYTDSGKLVPSNITFKLMAKAIKDNVLYKKSTYDGIIFDGFPRQIEQLEFLDKFLSKSGNKVDAVVSLDIEIEKLVERLSGRYMCSKCGEIYHKITKPTKVEGICDKCGNNEFKVREDDKNIEAIRARFKIFEEQTKPVLEIYEKRNIVIHIDATKNPQEISKELILKLNEVKKKK